MTYGVLVMTAGCSCIDDDKCQEVMASVVWDFEGRDGVRITGSEDYDCASFAKSIADSMDEHHGQGSHRVERKNQTIEEFGQK
jgi:hypothetical protein